jgi:maltooligosyltrehalose synthase
MSLVVVAPGLVAGLVGGSDLPPIGSSGCEDTHILLPFPGSFETYRNAFTGAVKHLPSADAKIAVSELLADFPVELCVLGAQNFSQRLANSEAQNREQQRSSAARCTS